MLRLKMLPAASWYSGRGLLLLIILSVAFAHGMVLFVPFQFDDLHQIKLNRVFVEPANLPRFFTDPFVGSSTGHAGFFRPLLFITFLFDGLAGNGHPLPYRITSLSLLILFALTVRHFVILLLPKVLPSETPDNIKKIGAVTGLLVSVHPLLNESVLLATSRSSLMMAIFSIWALAVLLRQPQTKRSNLIAVLLISAALLTKESAVALAPLAVLISVIHNRDDRVANRLIAAWPIVLPVAVYIVFYKTLFQWMLTHNPHTPSPTSLYSPMFPLTNPARGGLAMIGFIRLFFYPMGMSLVHELPVPKAAAMVTIGYAIWPLSLISGVTAYSYGGKLRLAGAALIWFVIALAPSLLLVRLNTPLAEHRAVVAVVIPLLVISILICEIKHKKLKLVVLLFVCVGLGLMSLIQTLPWRTAESLWRHEVKIQPNSSRAWSFLADSLYVKGDLTGAGNAIRQALAIAPYHAIFLARAATIELAAGHPQQAGQYLKEGLQVEQNLPFLHLVEAERLASLGNLTKALDHAETAVRLSSGSSPALNALGNVLFLQGKVDKASDAYRRALHVDPDNRQAAMNLNKIIKQR